MSLLPLAGCGSGRGLCATGDRRRRGSGRKEVRKISPGVSCRGGVVRGRPQCAGPDDTHPTSRGHIPCGEPAPEARRRGHPRPGPSPPVDAREAAVGETSPLHPRSVAHAREPVRGRRRAGTRRGGRTRPFAPVPERCPAAAKEATGHGGWRRRGGNPLPAVPRWGADHGLAVPLRSPARRFGDTPVARCPASPAQCGLLLLHEGSRGGRPACGFDIITDNGRWTMKIHVEGWARAAYAGVGSRSTPAKALQ